MPGARRWINLGGGVHFQPSEWVKLVLIVAVARYFWNLAGRGADVADIGKAAALVCVPMALVLTQPDLGTALTYSPILMAGLFWGNPAAPGCHHRAGAFTGGRHRLEERQAAEALPAGSHQRVYQSRLRSEGSGYQIRQSLIAVGSGGIWGKGANKGTQTQGDFLPIPCTDFIFAAFCEEHGFVGAMGVLLIYFLILMRLIQNAPNCGRSARHLHHHGSGGCDHLPDRRQYRDGCRTDASDGDSSATDELWGILPFCLRFLRSVS